VKGNVCVACGATDTPSYWMYHDAGYHCSRPDCVAKSNAIFKVEHDAEIADL